MSKARTLLSLMEGSIGLGWIFNVGDQQVKLNSMFLSGDELTVHADFSGNLKNGKDFLSQFKKRLWQKGIEGDISILYEKPSDSVGATDRVNRFTGYSPTRISGPVSYGGSIVLKVDNDVADGIKHWHG